VGLLLAGCFSEVTNNPPVGDCGESCAPDAGVAEPDAGAPIVVEPPPPFTAGASTLAGSAAAGADDGDRSVARFDNPVTVSLGGDGLLYVADFNNGRIRTVDSAGTVATVVDQVGFQRPFAVVVASPTLLYVQTDDNDAGEHSTETGTIWKVDLTFRTTTVVARNIGRPRGLALLPDGRLLLSDNEHHVLRVLEPRTGAVSILAGAVDVPGHSDESGMAARFNRPYGVAIRRDGKIVVADAGNNLIRLVDMSGAVVTIAGTLTAGYSDGPRSMASFAAPQDVAVDASDNIYVADTDNHVIRRINTATDQVTTIAGDRTAGYLDHDDPLVARFFGLEGIDVAADGGTVYIADGNRGEDEPYNRVRVVRVAPAAVAPPVP
jgi:DNA-binding beta-propeller fold protein YncE